MVKSRYFIYAVTMSTIIIFMLGTWVKPAQANAIQIGTPTNTSSVVSGSGVVPSVDEQEALKSLIRSYVELRYHALSVSDSRDFRQNGFGNLISDAPSAEDFLRKEMAKLAVEIRRAELNRLRYFEYKYSLDFRSITVDPTTQIATILVTEGREVVYELSAELRPENPIVSRTTGIEHTILARKKFGEWKLISDSYSDDLWRAIGPLQSTEEILQITDEMISVLEASPRLSATGANAAEISATSTLAEDFSSHDYNRELAVQYALDHWDSSVDSIAPYNPDYFTFPLTDCQNFVSQAIYEGGNATMFIPNPQTPLGQGDAGWFYLNDQQYASGWTDVETFFERTTKFGPDDPETWREIYNQGPEGTLLSERLGTDPYQVPAGLMKGDVIQFEWTPATNNDNDQLYDHSGIVVEIVGGEPYIAAHTFDHDREPLSNFMPWEKIRFIHIERSNGYPPVKAEITQGSNDAGTNPILACNFSLGYNEAYFGLCPNGSSVTSGFRFTDIQIPQGAQVKYAYLTFSVDGPYNAPLDVNIYGEAAANSPTFSGANPPANRLTPNTPVLWNIADQWILGMRRTTPQLSSIIQNIIDPTTGWQSGNPLTFIFKNPGPNTNMRRAIAYERATVVPSLAPAKLIAAYDFNGTPPPTSTPIIPTSTSVPTNAPTSTPVPTNTPTPVPTNPPSQPTFCNICGSGCSPNAPQQFSNSKTTTLSFTETADLLYRVRDEVLSTTPEGQRLTDLYYAYISNIIQVLIENPDLSDQSMEILDLFVPSLQALVDGNGDTATITPEQVNSLQSFLDALVENGDPELQSVILSELETHPIADMAGMTMDQAWTYLNDFPSTPILDNFNRANGGMGHNWSGNKSKYTINANQLKVISSASNSDIYWAGQMFGADQEAYFTFSDVGATATEQDLLLKSQSNSTWGHGVLEVWYDALNQRAQVWTYEWHDGWVKHGADIPVTFADGDQFGALAYADGTVEVYKNGTLLATRDITSWSYYDQGGYIGLWFIGAQNAILDDFGGGTISGSMQSMMAGEAPERTVTSDQLNVTVNAAQFWQGIPLKANQTASVTFDSLKASVKPQSNGVWGDGTVQLLYDVPNQRIQVWLYDTTKGWRQIGKDIPVKFAAGDTFTVRVLSDGALEFSRNGKLIAKRRVSP